jgi:uncharacterized membrane-anchored protein YhcB (DUF1043 family)
MKNINFKVPYILAVVILIAVGITAIKLREKDLSEKFKLQEENNFLRQHVENLNGLLHQTDSTAVYWKKYAQDYQELYNTCKGFLIDADKRIKKVNTQINEARDVIIGGN